LDLFSGVGSFSAGIAEGTGGCIRVTHSIEIAPSAAKTCAYVMILITHFYFLLFLPFSRNFPSTKVYNQCANIVLKWCIKSHYGFDVERPRPIIDNGKPLDDPIKPGDIDVIICGVPW
jgi:DNA (cytosine-5)-methyltransferase 1